MRNVITGGPSCGKTSTLRDLSAKGYRTIPEAARLVIDQKISEGHVPNSVKTLPGFSEMVVEKNVELERGLYPSDPVFMDRSLADNIAYQKFFGGEVNELLVRACKGWYDNVFILDQLDYEQDYARDESEEEAKELHDLLKETYRELGYDIIMVPVMPIDERSEYILERI